MANNINHVVLKFPHHFNYSGYDNLSLYNDEINVINLLEYQIYSSSSKFLPYRLLNKLSEIYALRRLRSKLNNLHTDDKGITHFLYPENTLAYIKLEINERLNVVSSFHQPLEWFENLYSNRKKCLANLMQSNYGIALSSSQIPIIQEYLKIENVKFIPHGVYCDFFKPNSSIDRLNNKILIVGSWFRDFDLLKTIIKESNIQNCNFEFVIVAENNFSSLFKGFHNVQYFSGISNSELLNLYLKCSVLLLPLKDSVANNALLEGLSCGIPILVSDVGGVRDYTSDLSVKYISSDPLEIIQDIKSVIEDDVFSNKLSLNARSEAIKFDWAVIRDSIGKYYNDISIK